MDVYAKLRQELRKLADHYNLYADAVGVTAKTLSTSETIGSAEDRDLPLAKGRERMMEAIFRGARGQAFTDMFGDWQGQVGDLLEMELADNFHRAVFVASLNAIMRALGLADKTVHCHNGDPPKCAQMCSKAILTRFHPSVMTMIGYQPRIFEQLRKDFMIHVVDMYPDNVGRVIYGTKVVGMERTDKYVRKADILLVTGSTLVNNTINKFLHSEKPVLFYGVTIAGAAALLGLDRYCPYAL